jgi:large subunit ribosomal protein L9
MKVILVESVAKLGEAGKTVEVADGYARNYLIPRRLAVPADQASVRQLAHRKREIERQQAKKLERADNMAARLEAIVVRVTAKAGEAGRLYGSVTPADVSQDLEKQHGITIDRHHIELPDAIKVVGEHEAIVRVAPEKRARLRIAVEPLEEAEEEEAASGQEGVQPEGSA